MFKNKFTGILLMALLLIFVWAGGAEAHRMIIEEPVDNQVQVRFDDGSEAAEIEVLLYDAQEQIIYEGRTDSEGILEYDSQLEPYRIVTQDNMGHRSVWIEGQGSTSVSTMPLWLRVLIGLGVLIILAVLASRLKGGNN